MLATGGFFSPRSKKKVRFRITNITRPGNGLSSYGDNESMVEVKWLVSGVVKKERTLKNK